MDTIVKFLLELFNLEFSRQNARAAHSYANQSQRINSLFPQIVSLENLLEILLVTTPSDRNSVFRAEKIKELSCQIEHQMKLDTIYFASSTTQQIITLSKLSRSIAWNMIRAHQFFRPDNTLSINNWKKAETKFNEDFKPLKKELESSFRKLAGIRDYAIRNRGSFPK